MDSDMIVIGQEEDFDDAAKRYKPAAHFQDIRVALQAYYKPYLTIQRVSGDMLSLDSCYINLAIVEAPEQRQKDKEDLKAQADTFCRIPGHEVISGTNMNASIPLEKLFDKRKLRDGKDEIPKTILVQGRAGIGKTTLCKKLVHAYQGGLWNDRFDAVLWLPLRQLKSFKAYNLEDLLCKKYFSQHPRQQRESLVAALAAHKDKMLFILDGLDEILIETQTEQGIALEAFLRQLLQQEHVIITSRPSGVDTSILPKLDLELETVGFSTQNVKDYLHKVLNPDTANAVQDYIERMPLIQSLVNIPVQLDVICYSWGELPSDKDSLTMAGLYQTMVRRLWRKDAARLQKEAGKELTHRQTQRLLPHQIDRLMAVEAEYLSFLAFKGMQDDHKIEFDESTLSGAIQELDELREMANQEPLPPQLLDTLKQTSFLHTADAELDTSKGDSQCAWYFLHLTFQEYFAAIWLTRHLENNPKHKSSSMMTVEKTKAFIQQNKYNPRYEIVWWMVAGQLRGETLASFFDLLQGVPVDLIGGYHHRLLAACLKEGRNQLERQRVEGLETRLAQWLRFEMTANNHGYSSALGRMSYFPEEVLIRSLGQSDASQDYLIRTLESRTTLTQSAVKVLLDVLQGSGGPKEIAASALGKQSTLPESALRVLIGALEHENWDVRRRVSKVLKKQSTLPESALLALIGALQDEDWVVRRRAAEALGRQSALPESALLALIGALEDREGHVRRRAAEALGRQSTLSESALRVLIGALQDREGHVRRKIAEALGRQSTLPESALQALIGALQDEDEDVRRSAAEALGGQSTLPESALQALIGVLQHEDWVVRESAAEALGSQSTLPEYALLALISALQDEDEDVRRSAAEALGRQSTLPKYALLALIGALQDKDWVVRRKAAEALGGQSTLPESALQALIGVLQDEDEDVRRSAAEVLGRQSTLPESALQALIGALQHKNEDVRTKVAEALGRQSILPESALQTLIGALQDEDEDVRRRAAEALGRQSTLPEYALLALIGALQDEDWVVRRRAAEVLGRQSTLPEYALLALIGALQDKDWVVRTKVAEALGRQSTLPESALLALISALQDEDEDVRRSATEALGRQSTLPEYALLALIGALQDKDWVVRTKVAEALGRQSTLPESALQALIGALQDEDEDVRRSAAEALGGQSTLPESALQTLIGALQDEDWVVRESAAEVLGRQSTLPESALLALIGALQDEDEDVRRSAAEALGRQSTLTESALQALIGALQDENVFARWVADNALNHHVKSMFMAIPNLPPSAIKTLHRCFLIKYSSEYSASLWVQDNEVLFHTSQGPGKVSGLCAEDVAKVVNAFD